MVEEFRFKVEGKSVQKLSLSYKPSYHEALSWSCDDRISVVTDQCVYIITLLHSEDYIKSNIKHYLSCIPAKDECFNMDIGVVNNFDLCKTSSTNVTIKRLLDHAANPTRVAGVNFTSFKSAAWSPSGCDSYGRCILATLCLDHRLSLYMSNKMDKTWKEIFCITDKWQDNCKKLIDSDPKFKKIRKKVSPSVKNYLPNAKISTNAKIEMDYIDIVAFTSIGWCPVLLDVKSESSLTSSSSCAKCALLAAATKSGKVVFWKVAVPDGLSDVELIEGDLQSIVILPCSIAWYSTDGINGLLAVGGSNGQIEVFIIKILKDPDCSLTIKSIYKHMLWNDSDDIAVNSLCWSKTGENQTTCATLSASKGSAVIQFSVPFPKELNLGQLVTHVVHDGVHSAFISGLDVSQDGRVFTCDTDSSLQMIDDSPIPITYESNPSYCCYGIAVSHNGLYIALLHSPNLHRLQTAKEKKLIEVSIISLVSEEFLSNVITRQAPLGTLWDVQTAICQYYTHNDPPKKGPIVEFLDLPLESLPLSSLYVRYRLMEQISKNCDSDSFTLDDNESESNLFKDWKLETIETGRQIIKLILTSSLKLWLQNYQDDKSTDKARLSLLLMSDWLLVNHNDHDTVDLVVNVYNTIGDNESAALAISIREERLEGNLDIAATKDPLKEDSGVENQEPAVVDLTKNDPTLNTSQKTKSTNKLPCRERCKICQADIPLTSLITGQCSNSHAWKRCLLTFCICAEYVYHRCQDCGGCISLIGQEQSPWLQKLFHETQVCPLCNGWKDPREWSTH